MNKYSFSKKNLMFIGFAVIIFIALCFFGSSQSLSAQDDFILNGLIEEIETKVEYGQSRRYASYVIDSYLVNTELLDEINYHQNELLYIQIEHKENESIEKRKKHDYEYNIVLSDDYYRSLVKPYSYLYLGFSVLTGAEGYFNFQYFKELDETLINNTFDALVSEMDSKYTKDYTDKHGETVRLNSNRYWLDFSEGNESIYEVRNLYPYGIFYRKASLNYFYKYVMSKFPFDDENEKPEKYNLDTMDGYLFQLIEHLNNSGRFDVTEFITKKFRFRG